MCYKFKIDTGFPRPKNMQNISLIIFILITCYNDNRIFKCPGKTFKSVVFEFQQWMNRMLFDSLVDRHPLNSWIMKPLTFTDLITFQLLMSYSEKFVTYNYLILF